MDLQAYFAGDYSYKPIGYNKKMSWKYKGKTYSWGPPAERLMKNGKVMCPKCEKHEANLDQMYGVKDCDWCAAKSAGWSIPKGTKSVPAYIREQQEKHHDDFVQPSITENGKDKINPEFVRLYPDKVKNFFTPEQMVAQGYPGLVNYSRQVTERETQQKKIVDEYKRKVIECKRTGDPTQLREFMSRLRR